MCAPHHTFPYSSIISTLWYVLKVKSALFVKVGSIVTVYGISIAGRPGGSVGNLEKPYDVGTGVRISAQSHKLGFSLKSSPTRSGERLFRGYTKFDFTVDEGKERLNPSRDKKQN